MTTPADEMRALAARCEAATRADPMLDFQIAMSCVVDQDLIDVLPDAEADRKVDGGWAAMVVQPYTASIDAAMTLVPEGATWALWESGAYAVVVPPSEEPDEEVAESGSGDTPALALCAAALRARAALMENAGG